MSDDTQENNKLDQLAILNDDKIANGLFMALKPSVQAVDFNIKNVLDSQTELSNRLEMLEKVLSAIEEIEQFPNLLEYSQKMAVIRSRLNNITSLVNQASNRVTTLKTKIEKKEAERIKNTEKTLQRIQSYNNPTAYASGAVKPAKVTSSPATEVLQWDTSDPSK